MKKVLKTMLLVVGVLITVTACSNGKAGKSFDKIAKANDGYKLLDKYDAIQYTITYQQDEKYNQTCTLSKNGDGAILSFMQGGSTTVYCSQSGYKQETGKIPEFTVGWFMPDQYDKLIDKNVKAFLVDQVDGENVISEKKDGDNTIVTTKITKDGKEYHYKYTINTESSEIQKFEAFAVTDEKEELYASSEIKYNAKYQIPEFVDKLISPEVSREFTVVVDPGLKTEKTYKEIVPQNAVVKTYLEDSYDLYIDAQASKKYVSETVKPDANGSYPNETVYCIKK